MILQTRSTLRTFACSALITFSSIATAAAAVHVLDPAKSTLEFQFEQAGAQSKGHFGKFAVELDYSPADKAASRMDVSIDIKSVDTGDEERDTTLRGTELFDAAKFPKAIFNAVKISSTAPGKYTAAGKLTIRGVSRDVSIPLTLTSVTEQGKSVVKLAGKTTVKRLDFGIGQGEWKSTEWVGNDVTVSFNLRLVGTG